MTISLLFSCVISVIKWLDSFSYVSVGTSYQEANNHHDNNNKQQQIHSHVLFGELTFYSTYPGLVDHVDNGDETSLQGTSRAFRNATSLYKSLEGLQKKNKQKNKNLLEFLYDHGKNNCVFTF